MYFHNLRNYLPLKKDMRLHLNKLEPLHPRMPCTNLEKKMKLWKVYRQTDVLTDRQHAIRKAHLDFQLRWANNYKNTLYFQVCTIIYFFYTFWNMKNNLTVSYKTTCKYTRFMDKSWWQMLKYASYWWQAHEPYPKSTDTGTSWQQVYRDNDWYLWYKLYIDLLRHWMAMGKRKMTGT